MGQNLFSYIYYSWSKSSAIYIYTEHFWVKWWRNITTIYVGHHFSSDISHQLNARQLLNWSRLQTQYIGLSSDNSLSHYKQIAVIKKTRRHMETKITSICTKNNSHPMCLNISIVSGFRENWRTIKITTAGAAQRASTCTVADPSTVKLQLVNKGKQSKTEILYIF